MFRDPDYSDDILVRTVPNPELIASLYGFCRLGSLAIEHYLSAPDSDGCQRPGFEKPRGPEPLIQPYVIEWLVFGHRGSEQYGLHYDSIISWRCRLLPGAAHVGRSKW